MDQFLILGIPTDLKENTHLSGYEAWVVKTIKFQGTG